MLRIQSVVDNRPYTSVLVVCGLVILSGLLVGCGTTIHLTGSKASQGAEHANANRDTLTNVQKSTSSIRARMHDDARRVMSTVWGEDLKKTSTFEGFAGTLLYGRKRATEPEINPVTHYMGRLQSEADLTTDATTKAKQVEHLIKSITEVITDYKIKVTQITYDDGKRELNIFKDELVQYVTYDRRLIRKTIATLRDHMHVFKMAAAKWEDKNVPQTLTNLEIVLGTLSSYRQSLENFDVALREIGQNRRQELWRIAGKTE